MFRSDRIKRPSVRLVGLCAALSIALLGLVGGIAYGLVQQAAYQHEAQVRTSDYAKHARERITHACVGIAPVKQSSCKAQAEAEYQLQFSDEQRNELDLVAQRRSALWTSIMGPAALIGMGLSAVGAWLVWTTFRETKSSNVIARAESRAWINFEILETLMIHQTETWTLEDGKPPQKCVVVGDGDPTIMLKIGIKNIGKSPAYDIHWQTCRLKGQWQGRSEASIYDPGGIAFYESLVNRSGVTLAALMPDETSLLSAVIPITNETLSEPFHGVRSLPRYALYATYRTEGAPVGLGATGKVINFVLGDGEIFVQDEFPDHSARPVSAAVADAATHIS